MDGQRHFGIILEGQIISAGVTSTGAAAGAASAGGTASAGPAVPGAIFHDNGLGRRVQDITVRDAGFGNHHRGIGNEARHHDSPVLPGDIAAQHIAVAVFDGELGIGHRLTRDGIQLRQGQAAHGVVVEAEGLGVLGVDHHGLALVIGTHDVAIRAFFLRNHQGPDDIGDLDLPIGIREVDTVGGQLAALGVHYAPVGVE